MQYLEGASVGIRSIRMQGGDGRWVSVTASSDPRVKSILARMRAIASEIVDGLGAAGFTLRRADQVVELETGERHSVDLVLQQERATIYVEVKWSSTLRAARRSAAYTLRDWLDDAAAGCVQISPRGKRRRCAATATGVLCVSPHSWVLEVDGSSVAQDIWPLLNNLPDGRDVRDTHSSGCAFAVLFQQLEV